MTDRRRLQGLAVMELGGVLAVATLYQHQSASIGLVATAIATIVAWIGGWTMMLPKEADAVRQ